MRSIEDELGLILSLTEQEVGIHHLLVRDLKEQAELLRIGAIDGLIKNVGLIEERIDIIRRLRDKIKDSLGKLYQALNLKDQQGTFEELLAHIPATARATLRSYRNTLGELQTLIARISENNRAFVQDNVCLIGDLISSIIQPDSTGSCYSKSGLPPASVGSPVALNREI